MNGFKIFFWVAVFCVIVGLCLAYVPGCQPPDVSNCTWNNTTNRYDCPEETK